MVTVPSYARVVDRDADAVLVPPPPLDFLVVVIVLRVEPGVDAKVTVLTIVDELLELPLSFDEPPIDELDLVPLASVIELEVLLLLPVPDPLCELLPVLTKLMMFVPEFVFCEAKFFELLLKL